METRTKAPLSFSPDEVLGPLDDVERKNAPETPWARGDVRLLSVGPRVSVIGARQASHLGLKRAEKLARLLVGQGALVVSQFPSGHPVLRSNFPRRNRTMALLYHATVIVEAPDSSGSLWQGWEALRHGRPLFLMKSIIDDDRRKWPKEMLHYGARTLASGHEDELFELLPQAGELVRERRAF